MNLNFKVRFSEMSHRLPLNYGTLDKFLLEIREFIKNSDIQANPFFHLVKPTEENISKYRFYKPESLLFLTFDTIFFFPRIVIEVLYALAISIFWSVLLVTVSSPWSPWCLSISISSSIFVMESDSEL